MKKIIVNTNGAFEKDVPMRKTVDLTDDIGHVVRVGFIDDKTSVLDVGTLISKDFSRGIIIIRSFKSGELHAYDMDGTNSTTFNDANDIEFQRHIKTDTWSVIGGVY